MYLLMQIIMKHDGRESTRSHLEIGGKGEEDTLHPSQRVPQILSWNHLNLVATLTWIYHPHLTLVLQVMTGARRGRDLLREINIDREKEVINTRKKGERSVIRDPSAKQEEHWMVLLIVRAGVKVALIVMSLMFLEKIRSRTIILRRLDAWISFWRKLPPPHCRTACGGCNGRTYSCPS